MSMTPRRAVDRLVFQPKQESAWFIPVIFAEGRPGADRPGCCAGGRVGWPPEGFPPMKRASCFKPLELSGLPLAATSSDSSRSRITAGQQPVPDIFRGCFHRPAEPTPVSVC